MEIRKLSTPQELFAAAAEEVIQAAKHAVASRGRFTIALSGGSTPKSLFNLLATNAKNVLPWESMFFFWGDERHVPPTDAESNYRMADEAMLSKVPVPAGNIFRVPAENPDAAAAAAAYEQTIQKFFALEPGKFPRFDLILLGMGPDGHTASLFPGTAGIGKRCAHPGPCPAESGQTSETFLAPRQRTSGLSVHTPRPPLPHQDFPPEREKYFLRAPEPSTAWPRPPCGSCFPHPWEEHAARLPRKKTCSPKAVRSSRWWPAD